MWTHSEKHLKLLFIFQILFSNIVYCSKPLSDELLNGNEEIEVMLESYLMDYNTLSTKLEYLRAQIQNAEDLVRFCVGGSYIILH